MINGSTGDSGVLTTESLCFDVLRDRLLRGVTLGARAFGIFDEGDFNGEPGDAAPFLSCYIFGGKKKTIYF